MFDVERLLGQMLSKGIGRQTRGMGDAMQSVNGGMGGSVGKGALGLGALGVAWAAFEHFQEKQSAPTAPVGPPVMPPPLPAAAMPPPMPAAAPTPDASANREADASHLIRAMIAAANADGQIDAEERSVILERALSAGLAPATQQFLLAELNKPVGLADVISHTPGHLKRETYGASLMAIRADTESEHQYLQQLASGLELGPDERAKIADSLRSKL